MELAGLREPERWITRPRILEVELEADGTARQRHPPRDDGMEDPVQRRRVVIDDPITDPAVAVHEHTSKKLPDEILGCRAPET